MPASRDSRQSTSGARLAPARAAFGASSCANSNDCDIKCGTGHPRTLFAHPSFAKKTQKQNRASFLKMQFNSLPYRAEVERVDELEKNFVQTLRCRYGT